MERDQDTLCLSIQGDVGVPNEGVRVSQTQRNSCTMIPTVSGNEDPINLCCQRLGYLWCQDAYVINGASRVLDLYSVLNLRAG